MEKKFSWGKFLLRGLSYVLVAVAASAITLFLWSGEYSKLTELERVIRHKFIGQADAQAMRDAAASAMVDALGDRWSYYIPADEFAAYEENKNNAYVGVGITVSQREDGVGVDIREVTPGGSAQEGGVLPGDILIEAQGQSLEGMDLDAVGDLIRGQAGTEVSITVLRNEERLTFTLERRQIKVTVATGTMLEGSIGLIRINNFNKNCASQTVAHIKTLQEQGAKALIFDVRFNPGGYVNEMLQILDHLLPEGVLFREEDYMGNTHAEHSDKDCVELPMAVLVNGDSYSAAEFFAVALKEFDWATVVGEHTTGKGYYQNTIRLLDGSAVNLSTGKYFTPSGINLTEVGGLTPDVVQEVDDETENLIYAQLLDPAEDPQICAAVAVLTGTAG